MNKVFKQFRGKTLDDYVPGHETQQEAKEAIRSYIEHLVSYRERGRGLSLLGPVGVGKSMLACIVMEAAQEAGYRIECMEMASYVQTIKNSWRLDAMARQDYDEYGEGMDKLHERLNSVKNTAEFLLLDDVGREYPSESGWSAQQLFDLIRYRYNRGKVTLITSNLLPPQFDLRYTEGMTSFLMEATQVVQLAGHDYREEIKPWNEES